MAEKPDLRSKREDLMSERADFGPAAENTDFICER